MEKSAGTPPTRHDCSLGTNAFIYPPYNTVNEEWVYNLSQTQFEEWIGKDVGKEEEEASRHDKWCCMMLPRLQLLR